MHLRACEPQKPCYRQTCNTRAHNDDFGALQDHLASYEKANPLGLALGMSKTTRRDGLFLDAHAVLVPLASSLQSGAHLSALAKLARQSFHNSQIRYYQFAAVRLQF